MRAFQTLYFQAYIICFILSILGLLLTDYGEVVLAVNRQRTSLFDSIMPLVTWLGDGVFYAVVTLGLLIYRWRLGLFFTIAGLILSFVSAFLKRIVFGEVPRPTKYFEEMGVSLELIPGLDYATIYSFPSGHTMTIFLMTALLCFTIVPQRFHLILLFAAFLVGFSRIYLLQHFYADVVAGSMVGVVLAAVLTAKLYSRIGLKK